MTVLNQISKIFIAFKVKNYRNYFIVNGISLIGTWMQRLAMSWLVYKITNSATWLGLISFAGWFTAFLIMPWAGVLLDTFSRRKILVATQCIGFLQAAILAYVTISGQVTPSILILLSIILGVVNGFGMPGRHAFVLDLVKEKELLANAIALNSTMFNLARLAGPAFAGIIVAKYGEGSCFILNSLSFLPAALLLSFIQVRETGREKLSSSYWHGIKEGWHYVRSHKTIFPVIILLATASFMGMSLMVLLPVLAKKTLMGNSQTLGFLTGAMGLGAVVGALWLASRSSIKGMPLIINIAFGSYGILSICLGWSHNFTISIILMILIGFCVVSGWSSGNTLLQTISDQSKRSRVMSIYLMCFTGMSPIGGLLMGWLSTKINVSWTMTFGGFSLLVVAIILIVRQQKISLTSNKLNIF